MAQIKGSYTERSTGRPVSVEDECIIMSASRKERPGVIWCYVDRTAELYILRISTRANFDKLFDKHQINP